MVHKFLHCGGAHWLGHSDPPNVWALSYTDQSSTGHSDLIVDEQPNSLRNYLHLVNWSPFGSALVISHPLGCAQPTTTLHTPSITSQGMHLVSLTRKDRYWVSIIPAINHSKTLSIYNCTYPSHSDLPFSILTSEPKLITNQQLPQSLSPQMPSLGMLWPHTTLQQTSHDANGLISNVMCSTT